jgi:uncharacterized membrane protein YccC
MPPAVPLVLNLNNPDYCDTVYGGSDAQRIAERFSRVNPQDPATLLESWRHENISHRMPRKLETLRNLPERVARFITLAVKELRD